MPPGGGITVQTVEQRFMGYEYFFTNISWAVDNSISAQNQTQKRSGPRISPGVPVNIRDLVKAVASRPNCDEVLTKMAAELGKVNDLLPIEEGKTFIETVFDSMKRIRIDEVPEAEQQLVCTTGFFVPSLVTPFIETSTLPVWGVLQTSSMS